MYPASFGGGKPITRMNHEDLLNARESSFVEVSLKNVHEIIAFIAGNIGTQHGPISRNAR